jgi:hypothetical protein
MNKTVSITSLPSATGFGPGDTIIGVHSGNASQFPYELINTGGTGSGATGPTGPTGPTGATGVDGNLNVTGAIEFPLLAGNQRTGSGNNIQFLKGYEQKIISTQEGTEEEPIVERLVISGGDSYHDGSGYVGEGGDIYIWSGKGANGGDIKVDAGESTSGEGGTIKIRGGYSASSIGGFVEIYSGYGGLGGGDISITASGGGTGIEAGGEVSVNTVGGTWTFKNSGGLRFPDSSIQDTAAFNIIETTYSELVSSITGSQLITGSYYKITNFKTCYDVPEYYVNGNAKDSSQIDYRQGPIEPIIVLATGVNTISSTAYQTEYPKDRIQYDWTWASTERTGGDAYGRISERIDEYNNRTDYDHRNIYFNRFQSYNNDTKLTGHLASYNSGTGIATGSDTLFTTEVSVGDILLFDAEGLAGFKVATIVSNTEITVVVDDSFGSSINFSGSIDLYTSTGTGYFDEYKEVYVGQKNEGDWNDTLTFNLNGGSLHNYVGDYSKFYLQEVGTTSGFLLANNVFNGDNIYSNTIGDRSYNNTGRYWFVRNTIAGRFYNNVIHHNGFYSNTIGEYFDSNIIKSPMYSNTIGESFERNEVYYEDFRDNKISNNFNNNKTYSYFNNNLIGNGFNNNDIYFQFYDNKIGEDFNNNNLGDTGNRGYSEFYRNRIGNDFNNNYIGNEFQNNQIGNQFHDNNVNGTFYKNVIGNGFNNNPNIGYDFYGNHIGNGFNSNPLISDDFNSNQIGEYFNDNRISIGFSNNKIGNEFQYNTLGNVQYFNWNNTTIQNLTARTYNTFRQSLNNNIGNHIIGKELIMHDTVNNEYHKVKFTQWTQGGNGGGFSYERTKVYPTTESTVYFTKSNYGSEVDVIVEGSLEITRGNANGIYNVAVQGGWNNNAPQGTQWNSIYTQSANNGSYFQDNNIGNNYGSNTIGNNFRYNLIGNNFYNNNIHDGFGYGYDTSQGNVIGNHFYDNNIGEYFYNNKISDQFYQNTIGNYFQLNSIDCSVDSTNFNTYYGNIGTLTYAATGSSATDNSYTGLTGTTNGGGTGATFNVTVSGGIPTSVTINNSGYLYLENDIITISGYSIGGTVGNIDTFTSNAIGKNGVEGVYTNILSLLGTATFDITVDANSLVTDIQLNSPGAGYLVGNTLTILGSNFGGTDGADDVTIEVTGLYSDNITVTVSSVSETPSVYGDYNCTIFTRKGNQNRLSYYDEDDILTINDINK